jgi:hypothetical protein
MELTHILDHDVILAFVSGTTCKDLVRELGRNHPQTVDELMDVVARRRSVLSSAMRATRGRHQQMMTRALVGGPKNKKKKKYGRTSVRPSMIILSLLSSVRSLDDHHRKLSWTRCSKSPALVTREGPTTSSRIAAC